MHNPYLPSSKLQHSPLSLQTFVFLVPEQRRQFETSSQPVIIKSTDLNTSAGFCAIIGFMGSIVVADTFPNFTSFYYATYDVSVLLENVLLD